MEEKTKAGNTQKYLIFSIGSEYYGIPILKVREIIRFEKITPVHDTYNYIQGVINLRGKIVPIMDLRMKFGLDKKEYTDKTVFIILDLAGEKTVYTIGITVDAVHEVDNIASGDLDKTQKVGLKSKNSYMEGIIESSGKMIMILNIGRIGELCGVDYS